MVHRIDWLWRGQLRLACGVQKEMLFVSAVARMTVNFKFAGAVGDENIG